MSPENLITNEIINAALIKDKGDIAKLISWTQENFSKHGNNFFNVVKRINLTFMLEGVQDTTSYVAKINPCKPLDAFNPYRHRAMKKEIFFYTELLPLLNTQLKSIGAPLLRVPRYLHSSNQKEKEVIVFEDLELSGFHTFDRANEMDADHSIIMAREIALLHVASQLLIKQYQPRSLTEVFPLLVESWLTADHDLSFGFSEIFIKGTKHIFNLVKFLDSHEDMQPWLQNVCTRAMDIVKTQLASEFPWQVIAHGDYHRSNVLFKYENGKPTNIAILDWQTVRMASIGSELGYLAYSSYFNNNRDSLMPVVEKTYFDILSKLLRTTTFSHQELRCHIENNHFGLLLCTFLVPLSLCVKDPSELFYIPTTDEDRTNNELLFKERGIHQLTENGALKDILIDYLDQIKKRKLIELL